MQDDYQWRPDGEMLIGRGPHSEIATILRTTPSGQAVLLDGRRFRKDGHLVGGDWYRSPTAQPLTAKLAEERAQAIERHNNATRARNAQFDIEKLRLPSVLHGVKQSDGPTFEALAPVLEACLEECRRILQGAKAHD